LAGIIDVSGYFYRNQCLIKINKRLTKKIIYLLGSLGIRAKENRGGVVRYFNTSDVAQYLLIKKVKSWCENTVSDIDVRQVSENGAYYGWELDGNRRFLINDFTVTHNTGKTCMSVGAIEQIKNDRTSPYKGALIIMKGKGLIKNFKEELVFKCTDGRYIPENYDSLTMREKDRRVDKLLSEYYQFETFEIFSKQIESMSPQNIIREYSNHIIVIDEAHNLRSTEEKSQYNNIHRFLHTVLSCKTLLLTGTPMRDSPEEIATLMNLILPMDEQLPTDSDFVDAFIA
jgi:hypothetical protein